MLKKLILFAAILSLSACAFDKDSSRVNAKEAAEREKLIQTYKPVEGLYRGTMTTDTFTQPVELRMFTLEVEAGKNANGEERYLKVMRGNFKKMNSVDPNTSFKARFVPETGELILTNSKENLEADDVHTINANVSGQKINGDAITVSGDIGKLELTLISSASNKPGNSETEFNERLRRQYESIAGTYVGENILDGKVTFKGTLILYVMEKEVDPSAGGKNSSASVAPSTVKKLQPQLVGEFQRSDDPSNDLALILATSYQPEAAPPKLIMTGKLGRITNVPYEANFQGVFIDGHYLGSWRSSTRGFQGDFILKKVK